MSKRTISLEFLRENIIIYLYIIYINQSKIWFKIDWDKYFDKYDTWLHAII